MGKTTRIEAKLPQKASAEDLMAILDALSAARKALLEVLNQPRCSNLAHDVIHAEMHRISYLEDEALAQITNLPSISTNMTGATIATIINAQNERGCSGLEMLETCVSTLRKQDAITAA